MAASISGSFPVVQGLDRQKFWRHSVRTAGHARLLAKLLQGFVGPFIHGALG